VRDFVSQALFEAFAGFYEALLMIFF